MSQTYSTRQRETDGGRYFSTRQGRPEPPPPTGNGTVLLTPGLVPPPAVSPAPAPVAAPAPAPILAQAQAHMPSVPVLGPTVTYKFTLSGQGMPTAQRIAPGATGTVTLTGRPGGAFAVDSTITGPARVPDSSMHPALWLIHDMPVPEDIDPADLAQLPRGRGGTGNQPGGVFTMDGNPPTYGPASNTLSIAITPGTYKPGAAGLWHLTGEIGPETNVTYHPFVLLGPTALANIETTLPTGVVERILGDVFIRTATVHPELPLKTHFQQRLALILHDVLAGSPPPSYVDGSRYKRAAVTLEGIVRGIPSRMPTREACFLVANSRAE